jgi:alginate O-acetyltransferase complex protein AlgI
LLKYLKKAGRIASIGITFMLIMFGWIIFRSASLPDAWSFIRQMFEFRSAENMVWLNPKFWTMLALAACFSFGGIWKKAEGLVEKFYLTPGNRNLMIFSAIAILLYILNLATITSSGFSQFIYFRF